MTLQPGLHYDWDDNKSLWNLQIRGFGFDLIRQFDWSTQSLGRICATRRRNAGSQPESLQNACTSPSGRNAESSPAASACERPTTGRYPHMSEQEAKTPATAAVRIIRPTPEEDAAINAQIAADPDDFELDAEWFANAKPPANFSPETYRRSIQRKADLESGAIQNVQITLPANVVAWFKSQAGPGRRNRRHRLDRANRTDPCGARPGRPDPASAARNSPGRRDRGCGLWHNGAGWAKMPLNGPARRRYG